MTRLDDRSAGRVMQGVAAAGVLIALLGGVVGWNLVGRIDSASGATLELTAEALVTIEDTIVVADEVVGSTVDVLEAIELTLVDLIDTAEDTQPLLESLGELGTEVAPNLESATETLRSLADLGSSIDQLLDTAGSLPGIPSYDPAVPLSEQFGRLADDIEPLAETLRETSERIGPTVESTAELQARVADLRSAIGEVREDLTQSERLLSGYAETARGASDLMVETERGWSGDVGAARVLLVLGALVFAAGQIVPYWFGRELVERSALTEPDLAP